LWVAFGIVYVVWGSTYLAIRYGVQTMPPLLMAGTRFLTAGAILFIYSKLRGAPRPTGIHWRSAAIVGTLLLLGGNGLVCWGEQYLPSGLTALIIGSTPLWMTLLDWLAYGGQRPTMTMTLGLGFGMAGLLVLVGRENINDGGAVSGWAIVGMLGACIFWTLGSLQSRRMPLPASPLLATAMEMLCGGAMQFIAGSLLGEWHQFDPSRVTGKSLAALAYLTFVGSLVAFSAYVWLLQHASPSSISTYAYVNPVIAVFLGWALAGEKLGTNMLLAAGLILIAVVLVTRGRRAVKGEPENASGTQPAPAMACAENRLE
jgi:drug/metabolite transporter (DMT)-like permease